MPHDDVYYYNAKNFNISYTYNSESIPAEVYADGDVVELEGISITPNTHNNIKE